MLSPSVQVTTRWARTERSGASDGLRWTRASAGSTHTYVWDPSASLRAGSHRGLPEVLQDEVSGSGTDTFTYVHGLDLISRIVNDGTKFYYGQDGLGSVRSLTNSSGGVSASYDYDAFGTLTQDQSEPPNDFRFAGEQRDNETGFYYLRARYYDPAVGRFISQDPFPGIVGLRFRKRRTCTCSTAPRL